MSLSDIVNVTITRSAPTVTRTGFGRILILGSAQHISTDRFRIYTSLAGMVSDGYLTTDEEYKAATALLAQSPRPVNFMVGRIASGEDPDDALLALSLVAGGDDWYSLVLCDHTKTNILNAAAYIETVMKTYIASTSDSDVAAGTAGNVAETLENASYFRTALIVSLDAAKYPEASLLAYGRSQDPGSLTYAYKTLPGITVDVWTPTQLSRIQGYHAIAYVSVAGVSVTLDGWVVGNEYIDVIEGIDWTKATMQENIFQTIVDNPKIPYTDNGISLIDAQVRAVMLEGVKREIYSDFTIETPLASECSSADKSARTLNGISFDGTLAGAIQAVNITGTVHV